MQFARFLREGIRAGAITCTIRIWTRPRVKVGGRYRLGEGEIEVTSIQPISIAEITPELAQQSGFDSVDDLLKIAKHGEGENIYYIEFRYHE
ncbi:MAG: hypothetical protein U0175_11125 [Caldilineaceae bacterium]